MCSPVPRVPTRRRHHAVAVGIPLRIEARAIRRRSIVAITPLKSLGLVTTKWRRLNLRPVVPAMSERVRPRLPSENDV